MRYEIDDQNCVWIYPSETSEIANIMQPHWPDGTPWANPAEATAWAEQHILSQTDPTADYPGNTPAQPTISRPDPADAPLQLTQRTMTQIVADAVAQALIAVNKQS
jgi:hypothetical protein